MCNREEMELKLINWIRSLENGFVDHRVQIQNTQYGRGLVAIEVSDFSFFFINYKYHMFTKVFRYVITRRDIQLFFLNKIAYIL